MRLWSVHPRYLDSKGLVALWREALLAKKVLEGKTSGYKNHPQLIRFRESSHPEKYINLYLEQVYKESLSRGYNFSKEKFVEGIRVNSKIRVSSGQVEYEREHLLQKLKKRSIDDYHRFQRVEVMEVNPVFVVVEGGVENWEIVR